MNYTQTIEDTIHILRTTKLVWIFGFLSLLVTIISSLLQLSPLLQLIRENPILALLVSIALIYFSFIIGGGLIYAIYQNTLGQSLTFSDVWVHSKTKVFSMIGASLPAILLFFVYMVSEHVLPNLSFPWVVLIRFIAGSFICSLFYFSTCAIVINDVKAIPAAWVGFLIALKNFFHVLIITGTVYFIRLSLTFFVILILKVFNYPTAQKIMGVPVALTAVWIFYLLLIIPTFVFFTLGYLKFTEVVSYPALSKKQNAA